MGCRQHLGGPLVAEPTGFVAFCMSDGTIGDPGLNLVEGAWDATRLAYESAPPPDVTRGYAGGNLGSAVKTADGYLVAWASRGVTGTPVDTNSPTPPTTSTNRPSPWSATTTRSASTQLAV